MVQGITDVSLRKWTVGIIAFGAAIALAVSLWTITISLRQLGFAAWAVLPMAVLWFANYHPTRLSLALVILVVSLCVVGFGVVAYINAFFIHPDAQSGLVIMFAPLYQLTAAIPLAVFCGIAWLKRKRAQTH
jgi:uncharacterized membrane protein YczE